MELCGTRFILKEEQSGFMSTSIFSQLLNIFHNYAEFC